MNLKAKLWRRSQPLVGNLCHLQTCHWQWIVILEWCSFQVVLCEFSGPGDETAYDVFNGNFRRPYAVNGGPSNPNANGFFSSGNEIVPLAIVPSFLAWVLLCDGSLRTHGDCIWLSMNLRLGASSEYDECCSGVTGWCYSATVII